LRRKALKKKMSMTKRMTLKEKVTSKIKTKSKILTVMLKSMMIRSSNNKIYRRMKTLSIIIQKHNKMKTKS